MTTKEIMDAACKSAWEGRMDVGPIIRREMYGRLRDLSFSHRPEYVVTISEIDLDSDDL